MLPITRTTARITTADVMAKRSPVAAPPAKLAKARADFENVRVRKIANGHVTTQIGVRDGKFFKNETYSRSKPGVTVEKPKRAAPRPAVGEVGYLRERQ